LRRAVVSTICLVVSAASAAATDLPWGMGSAEVVAGNMVASKGGASLLLGSVPGAFDRASKGEALLPAYANQIGENATATAFSKFGAAFVPGGGVVSVVGRLGVGYAAGTLGRDVYKDLTSAHQDDPATSVGGLQARFSDTKSLTGVTNGIQQYVLWQDGFGLPSQPSADHIGGVPDDYSRKANRNRNAEPGPDDELIGRVPGSGDNFLDGLVNGITGGGALDQGTNRSRNGSQGNRTRCGVQYWTPNPSVPTC